MASNFRDRKSSVRSSRSRLSDASLREFLLNKKITDGSGIHTPPEASATAVAAAAVAASNALAVGRASFSSVREQSGTSDLAQTFVQSSISSLARRNFRCGAVSPSDETAVYDDLTSVEDREEESDEIDSGGEFVAPLTSPSSRLHAVWYPTPPGVRAWKQISLRGRLASKSTEDLRKVDLGMWESPAEAWANTTAQEDVALQTATPDSVLPLSALEKLPAEILGTYIHI